MQIIENDLSVFCDVDETLLLYSGIEYWTSPSNGYSGRIEILHPMNGDRYYLVPHTEHINLLKSYKSQGRKITVWSAQGYKWALAAVQALKLEDTVDFVMSKPDKFIDDKRNTEDILGSRVYIPHGIHIKEIE